MFWLLRERDIKNLLLLHHLIPNNNVQWRRVIAKVLYQTNSRHINIYKNEQKSLCLGIKKRGTKPRISFCELMNIELHALKIQGRLQAIRERLTVETYRKGTKGNTVDTILFIGQVFSPQRNLHRAILAHLYISHRYPATE